MKVKKELTDKQKLIRTCNMWTMTPAMKHSMIKSALRKLSMYWKPIQACKKNAKLDRRKIDTIDYHSPTKAVPDRELDYIMINYYECAWCREAVPEKIFTFKPKIIENKTYSIESQEIKLRNNVDVDHVDPVVEIWNIVNWHEVILKLLDEDVNQYQLLCKCCHKAITDDENKKRKSV